LSGPHPTLPPPSTAQLLPPLTIGTMEINHGTRIVVSSTWAKKGYTPPPPSFFNLYLLQGLHPGTHLQYITLLHTSSLLLYRNPCAHKLTHNQGRLFPPLVQIKTHLTSWLRRPQTGRGSDLAPFLRNKVAQLVVFVVQVPPAPLSCWTKTAAQLRTFLPPPPPPTHHPPSVLGVSSEKCTCRQSAQDRVFSGA